MAPAALSPLLPRLACLCAGLAGAILLAPAATLAAGSTDTAGAKGAQVYCFMRSNGNNHAVSWNAAYALIKRQNAGMFRTSPEHAAVMITEAVVQNPGTFPDCGRFLGDLFSRSQPVAEMEPTGAPSSSSSTVRSSGTSVNIRTLGTPSNLGGMTRSERYGT
ncbi:MAG: DUF6554 family protein [Synechococcaceae cyanobacterium]|nr:DUF6554 family protein [Synechococcaceae cyanobacterium]